MRRYVPSWSALQCFDMASKHCSFTKAAEELHVTQSAVSHHVRNLEDFVQMKLFMRVGNKLILTNAGRDYAKNIRNHLDGIEAVTTDLLSAKTEEQQLTVGTLPTFGARWLAPRLKAFIHSNPKVAYSLISSIEHFDFTTVDVDIAIQRGDGAWPNCSARLLMDELLVLVASPDLVGGSTHASFDGLVDCPKLQLASRRQDWPRWLRANDVFDEICRFGPCFDQYQMLIEAVMAGLGIAIIPKVLVEPELASGELVVPFGDTVSTGQGYYVVYPEHRACQYNILLFRDWLLSQSPTRKICLVSTTARHVDLELAV